MDEACCDVSCLSGFYPFGVVGPGSLRRIPMSLRACLCRLNQHRPQPQSKMPRRPCVRACCWFALVFLVPQIVAFACWCRTSRCRIQLWKTRLRPRRQTDVFGKCGGKSTGKHPCTRQDLAAAKRQRDVALSRVERAEERATEMQKQWQQALAAGNNLKAEQWEKKLEDAEQELKDAKKELKEAEQKYEAKASVQAGRGQAGVSAWVCCL